MARKKRTQYEIDCADRVKRLAIERKVTQDQMADALGITQGAVGQYLNGPVAINLKRLLDFCKVLRCAPHEIDPDQQIFDLFRDDEKEIVSLIRSADENEVREIRRFLHGYISKK